MAARLTTYQNGKRDPPDWMMAEGCTVQPLAGVRLTLSEASQKAERMTKKSCSS
jgi:hypothetical protein